MAAESRNLLRFLKLTSDFTVVQGLVIPDVDTKMTILISWIACS